MRTRQTSRKAINLPARYLTGLGEPQDVFLRDLSTGGCRFAIGNRRISLGAPIQIFVGGTGPHRAIVKWVAKGEAGINFTIPLDDNLVDSFQASHVPDHAQMNVSTKFEDMSGVLPQRFC